MSIEQERGPIKKSCWPTVHRIKHESPCKWWHLFFLYFHFCTGLGIHSFAQCSFVQKSLILMSHHERFAQIAHDNWATMRKSLMTLCKRANRSWQLSKRANRLYFFNKSLICSQKWAIRSKKCIEMLVKKFQIINIIYKYYKIIKISI